MSFSRGQYSSRVQQMVDALKVPNYKNTKFLLVIS